MNAAVFDKYLRQWKLVADGQPAFTRSSSLLPVRYHGVAAMLKVARSEEERSGALLMRWWRGTGAAHVYAYDSDCLLLERATGTLSLAHMASGDGDDAASRTICGVVRELHKPRKDAPSSLVPLPVRFQALIGIRHSGILAKCSQTASDLLANQLQVVTLHGDIHHGNVLDFGHRGWLAIDPKGLLGDRAFDYANIFCNPNHGTATAPGRLLRQVAVVAKTAGLEEHRLLRWVVAWAGLSAIWCEVDGQTDSVEAMLRIAEIAAAEIDQ